MKKDLIIFDCFGTLLKIGRKESYTHFIESLGLDIKCYYRKAITEKSIDWYSLVDSKKISMDDFKIAEDVFKKQLVEDNKTVTPYINNIQDRLLHLRNNYVVVLLSNLAEGYDAKVDEYISPYVDKVFYSFNIGLMKPELDAYNWVISWFLNSYCIHDEYNVWLVDDKENNVRAIESLGYSGIIVDNNKSGLNPNITEVFDAFNK